MDLYFKHPHEMKYLDEFQKIIQENPDLVFFHPNRTLSPWHVQVYVQGPVYKKLINIWPHKCKFQLDGEFSMSGWDQLREAIMLCRTEEEPVLIERDE